MVKDRGRKPPKTAEPFLPDRKTLPALKKGAEGCRGCDLYKKATQTVFGEGRSKSRVVFVGEQPGDHEDLAGHPFMGPAGKLLDRALEEVGIDREEVYVTNAVKHFKWVPRGKMRLHAKPRSSEIRACFPWLEAELEEIKPEVIICLGGTAANAVFGKAIPVLANRRKWLSSPFGEKTMITVHPSSILRTPGEKEREEAFHSFVLDLKFAKRELC